MSPLDIMLRPMLAHIRVPLMPVLVDRVLDRVARGADARGDGDVGVFCDSGVCVSKHVLREDVGGGDER